MKVTVQRTVVFCLLASSLFLTACGSSNSSSPNPTAGNIPNLSSRPSAQATVLKTQRLTGAIIDARTRRPIDRADIVLHLLSAPETSTTGTSATPTGTSPQPTSVPTGPPAITPTSTPFPSATPTPAFSAAPGTSGVTPEVSSSPPKDSSESNAETDNFIEGDAPSDTPPDSVPSPQGPVSSDAEQQNISSLSGKPISVIESYTGSQTAPSNNNREAKFNIFETRSNNRGKFFINDVPEGNYVISVAAPGYRSITLTEINPNRLEIPLISLDDKRRMDIIGSVLSPTNTPVPNAFVSSSFPMGEAIGIPATTNTIGEFNLLAVPFGRRSFFAFVQNADEEIQQMGLLKNIIVNDKSIKEEEPLYSDEPRSTPERASLEKTDTETLIKNIQNNLKEPTPEPSKVAPESTENLSPYQSDSAPEEPTESPLISPPIEPYPLPSTTQPPVTEENQEATEEKKGVNVFSAVKEFFTGESEEEKEEVKISPIVSLRSVIDNLKLAGTIDVPENYTLKSMDVYMTLEAEKGVHPEEVYLMTKTFRTAEPEKKSLISKGNQETPNASPSPTPSAAASANPATGQKFEVNLPILDKDRRYHLQFTATHKDGGITYHHLYNLEKENDALKVAFLPVIGRLEIEGEDDNTISAVPGMGWENVPGADIYHVTLEAGTRSKRRVVWEAWTKSTQIDYPFTARKLRLKEQETYTLSVAALKGVKPVLNKTKNLSAHPAYESIWADLSRVTHVPFEIVEY